MLYDLYICNKYFYPPPLSLPLCSIGSLASRCGFGVLAGCWLALGWATVRGFVGRKSNEQCIAKQIAPQPAWLKK